MKSMRTLMFAGLAAAGLALAGCGSDGGPSQADLDAERDRTEQQMMMVTQLQNQINALRTQLGLPADGNLGTSIQGLQDEVTRLQGEIDRMAEAERMAAEEEARKMAAATGKALYAALAGNATAGTTARDNIDTTTTPETNLSDGLTITPVAGAGSFADTVTPPAATLRAGDSAGALGSWNGTNYGHTHAETKVENAAVVYNNQGPGRSQLFSAAGITVAPATATGDDIPGYVTLVEDDAATLRRIMADDFTHSGTQDHAYDTVDESAFTTRGTFAGAPGVYRCTGDCSSTNDGKGSPSALGGVWHFKPDAGTSAMTHTPDANYLYYGWWVSKDKDGDPTAASVFTGVNGAIAALTADPASAVTGSATYAGHAAGKFALDYSKSKLIDGASDGGHFTADVELTATFGGGSPTNPGVTGTLDNFMANGESVDWSVALHRAPWGTAGAFATPTTDVDTTMADERLGTTWTIGGTAADRSGTWSGQMYDEMPGNTDDTPPGDGSNVPTTATGTFYSEYGAGTSTVGRMVGAFGADKQ